MSSTLQGRHGKLRAFNVWSATARTPAIPKAPISRLSTTRRSSARCGPRARASSGVRLALAAPLHKAALARGCSSRQQEPLSGERTRRSRGDHAEITRRSPASLSARSSRVPPDAASTRGLDPRSLGLALDSRPPVARGPRRSKERDALGRGDHRHDSPSVVPLRKYSRPTLEEPAAGRARPAPGRARNCVRRTALRATTGSSQARRPSSTRYTAPRPAAIARACEPAREGEGGGRGRRNERERSETGGGHERSDALAAGLRDAPVRPPPSFNVRRRAGRGNGSRYDTAAQSRKASRAAYTRDAARCG